jgi:hypothetical protein
VYTYISPGPANNISIPQFYLFLREANDGVTILSIADPSHPVYQSSISAPTYANDAAAVDTILYIADDSAGVTAYSINNPLSPYELAGYDSPGAAKGIFVSGMNVYLGDYYSFIILVHTDTPTGIEEGEGSPPSAFSISSVYPNPFNAQSVISFEISRTTVISLDVFDLSGRLVENIFNRSMDPGSFSIAWDGAGYSSGIYFFRLSGGGFSCVKKATLLK